jgi:hypothetical protein
MDKPKTAADFANFTGMELQADAHDLEVGKSQEQVNILPDQKGSMRTRGGTRLVSFAYEA